MILPPITDEDRQFLHYNPNTDDVVAWVQAYAAAAVAADRLARSGGGSAHTGPAAQLRGGSGGSGGIGPVLGENRQCPTCGITYFAGEGWVHCGDRPMVKISG